MSTGPLNSGRKLFSDESNFQVFQMRSSIIRPPSSSDWFDPRFKVPTVKHLESVMIWGSFSGEMSRPKAGFYFLPKKQKINGKTWKKYWRSICWPCFILMAVKCLCRIMLPAIKCKKVKNYLHQKQIKMLEWPGNCPDLNWMENCKQKIKYLMKQKKIPNINTLKNQLKKVWCQEVHLDYFRNLVFPCLNACKWS